MSSKSVFLISIILGTAIGAAAVYGVLYTPVQATIIQQQNTITTLNRENTQLTSQLNELEQDYTEIREKYYTKLDEYTELHTDYTELQNEYTALSQEYDYTYTDWVSLSEDVVDLYQYINSYVDTEESFKRILNYQELQKISPTIETITRMGINRWDAYLRIHEYVRDEVTYAHDEEIPVITTYSYHSDEPDIQLTGIQYSTRRNYLQSLDYTVEYLQGDCDDQAMLEYAMIQYYRDYIYGTSYGLYLARIAFNNEISHLAVFMPVSDQQICILDPAGSYQTGTWNSITGKNASTELNNYDDHWDDEDGIKEITLWSIDIDTGEHTERFKGTLNECITFFNQ